MADNMGTDTGLMAKTAQDVDGVADRLSGMLRSLMNELAPLQADWVGAGGSSFQGVRDRFDGDMARLNTALRAIAHAVRTSGQGYAATDSEMQSELNNAGGAAGSVTQSLRLS